MTDDYRGFCRYVMTTADSIHLTAVDSGIQRPIWHAFNGRFDMHLTADLAYI